MWWLRLGIGHERIAPGSPEQNGRHERMHETLKQETAAPPRATLGQQQKAFAAFEREYNEERPHEALGNRTPAEVYQRSERAFPARLPELEYPAGVYLRRISQQGSLKWKTKRTFLSEVLARETVGLLEVEDEYFARFTMGRCWWVGWTASCRNSNARTRLRRHGGRDNLGLRPALRPKRAA